MAVEAYVAREVLPFYANTHTTTSVTGAQSTCFRHEARQMVAEAVNAKVKHSKHDRQLEVALSVFAFLFDIHGNTAGILG
jgi:selenocysteine lyase/cysteine desulfurase